MWIFCLKKKQIQLIGLLDFYIWCTIDIRPQQTCKSDESHMKNEIWIHSHTKSVNEVVDTINIEHLLPAPQVLTLSHPWQDF